MQNMNTPPKNMQKYAKKIKNIKNIKNMHLKKRLTAAVSPLLRFELWLFIYICRIC